MPVFDEFDDPTLEDDERSAVIRRLDNLMADPVRQDFNDPDVVAYTDRQRDRLTDANGAPVRSDFESFRPAVQRSDIRLESPVGPGEANHPMAVFNTKKLLSKTGFHEFAPGVEGFSEASPRFLADLRRFQTAHDLAPDATAQPGGPTVHMLTRKVFGPADGPPPESESEHFEDRFAKDPNRTLSGQPIFGGQDGGYIEAGGTEIQQAAWRGGRGGQLPGGKRARKWIDDLIRRGLRSPSSRSPKRWPETNEPVIGETPVTIFRYPDGRLYLPVGKDGEISVSRREPGSVSFEPVMNQVQVAGMRAAFHKNYPNLDDRTSFEERHAHGKESYVYGPAYDENGKLTGYLPLRDPVTDRALRIPVGRERYLTDAQIRAMGLQQWQTKPKPSR